MAVTLFFVLFLSDCVDDTAYCVKKVHKYLV